MFPLVTWFSNCFVFITCCALCFLNLENVIRRSVMCSPKIFYRVLNSFAICCYFESPMFPVGLSAKFPDDFYVRSLTLGIIISEGIIYPFIV